MLRDLPHFALTGVPYGAEELAHPYPWWYLRRNEAHQVGRHLGREVRKHYQAFQEYVEASCGKDWEAVRDLTARGKITPRLLEYIFVSTLSQCHLAVN